MPHCATEAAPVNAHNSMRVDPWKRVTGIRDDADRADGVDRQRVSERVVNKSPASLHDLAWNVPDS